MTNPVAQDSPPALGLQSPGEGQEHVPHYRHLVTAPGEMTLGAVSPSLVPFHDTGPLRKNTG